MPRAAPVGGGFPTRLRSSPRSPLLVPPSHSLAALYAQTQLSVSSSSPMTRQWAVASRLVSATVPSRSLPDPVSPSPQSLVPLSQHKQRNNQPSRNSFTRARCKHNTAFVLPVVALESADCIEADLSRPPRCRLATVPPPHRPMATPPHLPACPTPAHPPSHLAPTLSILTNTHLASCAPAPSLTPFPYTPPHIPLSRATLSSNHTTTQRSL